MDKTVQNIFQNLPEFPQKDEIFETILEAQQIKIEKIVSTGQTSPTGFWYEQQHNEFILLLSGEAELEFEEQVIKLNKGDYLHIPAGLKHRVKSTSKSEHTIWLAVFF